MLCLFGYPEPRSLFLPKMLLWDLIWPDLRYCCCRGCLKCYFAQRNKTPVRSADLGRKRVSNTGEATAFHLGFVTLVHWNERTDQYSWNHGLPKLQEYTIATRAPLGAASISIHKSEQYTFDPRRRHQVVLPFYQSPGINERITKGHVAVDEGVGNEGLLQQVMYRKHLSLSSTGHDPTPGRGITGTALNHYSQGQRK